MRCAATRRHRRGGFTFIEMLVVIAILSTLASIVVVNLDAISAPTELDGAARRLGNQVLVLHDTAALTGRVLSLEIDLDHDRWRIVDAPSATDVPDPRDREEETYRGEWSELGRHVHLAGLEFGRSDVERGGTTTVSFDATGELWPSGFVAFFTHDRLGEKEGVSVEVSGLTGLVAYHHGRFRAEEVRRAEDF